MSGKGLCSRCLRKISRMSEMHRKRTLQVKRWKRKIPPRSCAATMLMLNPRTEMPCRSEPPRPSLKDCWQPAGEWFNKMAETITDLRACTCVAHFNIFLTSDFQRTTSTGNGIPSGITVDRIELEYHFVHALRWSKRSNPGRPLADGGSRQATTDRVPGYVGALGKLHNFFWAAR